MSAAVARIDLPTGPVEFHFPNTGNMARQIAAIFGGNEYPSLPMRNYMPTLIVDVGANVGATALYFSACFPGARVICYEPSASNFEYLRTNLGTDPRFVLHRLALSDSDGEGSLFLGDVHAMQNSLIRSAETTDRVETVPVRRASAEWADRGIGDVSILKLDTEGCEVPILRDLGPSRLARVDVVYVEYHSENGRRAIDQILGEQFILASAVATSPHRGTNAYVSRRLCARFPEIDAKRIGD